MPIPTTPSPTTPSPTTPLPTVRLAAAGSRRPPVARWPAPPGSWRPPAGPASRCTRAVRSAPDVLGLALRVPRPGGGHGDLLFSTTGLGALTRFVLVPRCSWSRAAMTTLLP